jgi:hypothetical protein
MGPRRGPRPAVGMAASAVGAVVVYMTAPS